MEIAVSLLMTEFQKVLERRRHSSRKRREIIRKYLKLRREQDYIFFFNYFIAKTRVQRRFWCEPSRIKCSFYEEVVSSWTEDKLWRENFRLSKGSFLFICKELEGELRKEDTRFRKAVTVDKKVAICLWHIATGEDLRSLGWRFGVAKSTACQIVNDVCQAIVNVLMPQCIVWPKGDYLDSIVEGFANRWNFPQCAGAIDGTHIPIVAPTDCPANYYNRKHFYSLVVQVIVDHQYRFTDVNIKMPGKVHDARVLAKSHIFTKGQEKTLFPDSTEEISGCSIPIMLIGDSAYPLLTWLMKGYLDRGNLTPQQSYFNYRLSSARMVVEKAIGHLKGRFRCLLKTNETTLQYLPAKIAACCTLHNLCEMKGEVYDDKWTCADVNPSDNLKCFQTETSAENVRLALTDHFCQST